MIVGKVFQMGVENIPEKGVRSGSKYPFASLEVGEAVLITPEEKDDISLTKLRKQIVGASQQYNKRMGKRADGKKAKEFTVWVDETEGGVFIGCTEDNSNIPDTTAPKKSKKNAPKKVEDFSDLTNQ